MLEASSAIYATMASLQGVEMSLMPVTLTGTDIAQKRAEVRHYFLETYALYEQIFALLKDDSVFYRQSEPTRHPMIFYFGHTATFFVNKLILANLISERINPEFESIFAIGVDEMQWDDMDDARYQWPEVEAVRAYRAEVKRLVCDLIEELPLQLPITQESPFWVILMGIEHERIHIETSLVLHRQMPIKFIKDVPEFILCNHSSNAPVNEMLPIRGAEVRLGKDKTHHLYGWDNEYGTYSETVGTRIYVTLSCLINFLSYCIIYLKTKVCFLSKIYFNIRSLRERIRLVLRNSNLIGRD